MPATGGHSPWSTVENGIVIDLSRYKEVMVDRSKQSVIVRGGVLMKELQIALSEQGQFTGTFVNCASYISSDLII